MLHQLFSAPIAVLRPHDRTGASQAGEENSNRGSYTPGLSFRENCCSPQPIEGGKSVSVVQCSLFTTKFSFFSTFRKKYHYASIFICGGRYPAIQLCST